MNNDLRLNQFLLYVRFPEQTIYTLIGGLRTNSLSINKSVIETMDFAVDRQFFLEGSGVSKVSLRASGIISDALPEELFERLITYVNSGMSLEIRLENEFLNTLEGRFFLFDLDFQDAYDNSTDFSLSLESQGEFNFLN